jgi:DNA helicase IV
MCAPHLSAAERALLARERDSPWTAADVPLLDEAAELLGEEPDATRTAAQQAEERSRVAFARDVLSTSAAGSMITAAEFARRWEQPAAVRTVAERASEDRSWAFGHVVVDEAQELSPMMWRLLFRRCPSRSMTVVGDVAQTGALDGVLAWGDVFDRHSRGNWRVQELTVNYRTPRQVMELAGDVLAAAGVNARPPDSVRDGAFPPSAERIDSGDLAAVVEAVRTDLAAVDGGRIAVISAPADQASLAAALRADLDVVVGHGRDALDAPVAVMTVADVKGLEFDGVVLYEPEAIVSASARGANDLYVALTRPTQRLRVLYIGDLPYGLMRLAA